MINYSIRPVLWEHKKNAHGVCPLMIRITIDRKNTYFKTSFKLLPSQWNDAAKEIINYENKGLHNTALRLQIANLEKAISIKQIEGREVTARSLKHKTGDREFKTFAAEVRNDKKEINRVNAFAPGIMLSDMNVQFLRKYHEHELSRGMSMNTTNTTFKFLRRIIRQAYAEKIISENPFEKFKVPKYTNPERTYLTIKEVDKIEAWIKTDIPEHLYITAVWFLFGCYTGLRFSDWELFNLKDNVREGRIIIRAKKNQKDVSMRIYTRLKKILTKMKDIPPPYSGQKTNFFLKEIEKLAGVGKYLTCHVSRHTFGTLMATQHVSIESTAELMGIDVKTVKVYYQVTGVKVDLETKGLDKM